MADSIAKQLSDLGFVADSPRGEGDFVLQDDSDGQGPYIAEWRSASPCPFPELIRQ